MSDSSQTQEITYHQAGKVKHKPTPSQDLLRELFDYDPESGCLINKKTGKQARAWKKTGSKSRWQTSVMGETFRHCRLVWAWHYGDPGVYQIDHIDSDRRNDRIENLRLATNSQNNAAKKHFKGYSFRKCRFYVDVMKNKKHYRAGSYLREEDAAKAAAALRKALHGEFAETRLIKPSEILRSKTEIQLPLFS